MSRQEIALHRTLLTDPKNDDKLVARLGRVCQGPPASFHIRCFRAEVSARVRFALAGTSLHFHFRTFLIDDVESFISGKSLKYRLQQLALTGGGTAVLDSSEEREALVHEVA